MINVSNLLNLITSEYTECVKFKSLLQMVLQLVQNVANLNHEMSTFLNLDTAEGKTLDMIGSIVGIPRQVDFQPSEDSSILTDEYYRVIIKAKIIKNQWDGTIEGLYNLWGKLFPDNPIFIIDGQNMTAQVAIFGFSNTLYQELITHEYIIPRPSGVKYFYGFVEDVTFAFDLNTEYLKGWDLGKWLNLEE